MHDKKISRYCGYYSPISALEVDWELYIPDLSSKEYEMHKSDKGYYKYRAVIDRAVIDKKKQNRINNLIRNKGHLLQYKGHLPQYIRVSVVEDGTISNISKISYYYITKEKWYVKDRYE